MKNSGRTQIGGARDSFHTTHWTLVFSARTEDGARRREVEGVVLGPYWKPVYCYLRRKGYDNEKAKDLTQGFFGHVLEKGIIQRADREKGKFRTFLLTALDRYATSVYRKETARKRMPIGGMVPLDGLDGQNLPEPAEDSSPEQAMTYALASELLDKVLAEVMADCCEEGLAIHWQVFQARVIQPIVDGMDPPSLADVCREYGIADEAKASNMAITVKRRLCKALRAHVRQLVNSDDEVDGEISDLMRILSKPGAGE